MAWVQSYYSLYGGSGGQQHHQFSPYYAASGAGAFQNFYPFHAPFSLDSQAQSGYGLSYPQMPQYPYLLQQYRAGSLSMHPSIAPITGKLYMPSFPSNAATQVSNSACLIQQGWPPQQLLGPVLCSSYQETPRHRSHRLDSCIWYYAFMHFSIQYTNVITLIGKKEDSRI